MSQRACTKCGKEKPLRDFVTNRSAKSGKASICKPCKRIQSKAWQKANKEKVAAYSKAYRERLGDAYTEQVLRRKYGITLETYLQMLEGQGYACAICNGDNNGKRLVIDHCHETGHVRGLLCGTCNLLLGHAGDSRERLLAAVSYLDTSTAGAVEFTVML